MAATGTPTPNIGLRRAQGTDPASVDDINYNSALIDTKLGAVGNSSVQDQIDTLNGNLTWKKSNNYAWSQSAKEIFINVRYNNFCASAYFLTDIVASSDVYVNIGDAGPWLSAEAILYSGRYVGIANVFLNGNAISDFGLEVYYR